MKIVSSINVGYIYLYLFSLYNISLLAWDPLLVIISFIISIFVFAASEYLNLPNRIFVNQYINRQNFITSIKYIFPYSYLIILISLLLLISSIFMKFGLNFSFLILPHNELFQSFSGSSIVTYLRLTSIVLFILYSQIHSFSSSKSSNIKIIIFGFILFLISNSAFSRNPSLPYLISILVYFLPSILNRFNIIKIIILISSIILFLIFIDLRRAFGTLYFGNELFELFTEPELLIDYVRSNEFSTPLKFHLEYQDIGNRLFTFEYIIDYLFISPIKNIFGKLDYNSLLSVQLSIVGRGTTYGGFPGSSFFTYINPILGIITPTVALVPLLLNFDRPVC